RISSSYCGVRAGSGCGASIVSDGFGAAGGIAAAGAGAGGTAGSFCAMGAPPPFIGAVLGGVRAGAGAAAAVEACRSGALATVCPGFTADFFAAAVPAGSAFSADIGAASAFGALTAASVSA